MRRIPLALLAILLGTAGIRAGSPPQTTVNSETFVVLTSVHYAASVALGLQGSTSWTDSALYRAYAYQPDEIILVDDVVSVNPQFSGLSTADSAVLLYRNMIQRKSKIPVYGGVNNHDYMTDRIYSADYRQYVVAADSADPLRYARQVIPELDWYGNYYVDTKLCRFIFLNTCYTSSLAESCLTDSLYWTIADTLYQPASMFSNWNSTTGAGYLFVKAAIQTSQKPHTFLIAPNGFYGVQSERATGAWCWNRNKTFMAMMESTTTASGKKVTAVFSGHQHCAWHIGSARGDSLIAHASGGIDHINGPPCAATHAAAAKAQDYGTQVFPDTVPVTRVARWQDYGGINGALLQYSAQSPTRPSYIVVRASATQLKYEMYDSSRVVYSFTRGVR